MWWRGFNRAALRRLFHDRRGVTAVEFGFVGLIFFMLLLGAVDLGRYQFTAQSLREIAAIAARAALINGNTQASPMSDSALKASVTTPTNPTPFLNPALLTLTTTRTTNGGLNTVTVTVTYPFEFVAPVLSGPRPLTEVAAIQY